MADTRHEIYDMRSPISDPHPVDVLTSESGLRRPVSSRVAEITVYTVGAVCLLVCGWIAVSFLTGRTP